MLVITVIVSDIKPIDILSDLDFSDKILFMNDDMDEVKNAIDSV